MATPRRRPTLAASRVQRLAFSYTRFSDQKQGSIEEQDAINDEIALDHDLVIEARFSDAETSRSLAHRPGLMAMFEALKARPEVGFIVVNELERMTAGVGQRATITALCQEQRVTIATEDSGLIDPYDEKAMQMADERAVAANAEVLKIRRRTRRNLRQKVIAGTVAMRPAFGTRMAPLTGPDGTMLPSGARFVDAKGKVIRSGQLEIHPDELPWLRRIFDWAGEGASNDAIARRLTEAGVKTKTGKELWRANTVAGILSNPLYKGEMTWGLQATVRPINGPKRLEMRTAGDPGIVTKASPLGPLVDVALWERINADREQRPADRQHNKAARERHLFDGQVYCARCGHKMYGRPEGYTPMDGRPRRITGYRYYCYSMRPGWAPLADFGPPCGSANSISEKKLIQALGTLGLDDLPALDVVVKESSPSRAAERRVLEDQLAGARTKLDRAEDLALDGLISKEKLAAARTAGLQLIDSLTQQLDALRHREASSAAASGPWLHQATTSLRELPPLLLSEDLSLDDKLQALRRVGLSRLYVDGPRVQVRLLS